MNIKNIQNITKAYGEQTKVSNSSKMQSLSPAQRPDEVILSSHAQEVSPHLRALRGMSEVRESKVKDLSDKIASGEYKVDSRELAERIIAYSKNERLY